jgi:hypothetical protein
MKCHQIKFVFVFFALVNSTTAISQKFSIEHSTVLKISASDSSLLLATWNSFLLNVEAKNYKKVKDLSLVKVYVISIGYTLKGLPKNELMRIDLFIDSIVAKFYDGDFMKVLTDSAIYIFKTEYPDRIHSNFNLPHGEKLILYSINFNDLVFGENGRKYQNYYVFQFVKCKNEFKFFGLELESPRAYAMKKFNQKSDKMCSELSAR